MANLDSLINFTRLLHEFRKVGRVVRVVGDNRYENDTEHSYNLALVAWYVLESGNFLLNKELVIKYALIHDFVEVYAGDTDVYSRDSEHKQGKKEREHLAAERLRREIPEFADLHNLIKNYEGRNDPESRFVYALDKIEPVLNIYVDGGRTWRERGITINMLVGEKKDKVALSPEIEPYFKEVVSLLRKDEKRLFGTN